MTMESWGLGGDRGGGGSQGEGVPCPTLVGPTWPLRSEIKDRDIASMASCKLGAGPRSALHLAPRPCTQKCSHPKAEGGTTSLLGERIPAAHPWCGPSAPGAAWAGRRGLAAWSGDQQAGRGEAGGCVLDFASHARLVATAQLCCCSGKVAADKQTDGPGCVPRG